MTAKTNAEATVRVAGTFLGKEAPPKDRKVDLTKPFDLPLDPPAGAEAKVEKLKEGAETVTVAGKKYEATWTTYKINGQKVPGVDVEAEVKVWTAKAVPLGVVKVETTSKAAGTTMEMALELTESGHKE